jgi:hypothetical protein
MCTFFWTGFTLKPVCIFQGIYSHGAKAVGHYIVSRKSYPSPMHTQTWFQFYKTFLSQLTLQQTKLVRLNGMFLGFKIFESKSGEYTLNLHHQVLHSGRL